MFSKLRIVGICASLAFTAALSPTSAQAQSAPTPLIATGQPADWVFVFKMNSGVFPTKTPITERNCLFGGTPQAYKSAFSQQYVYRTRCAGAVLTLSFGEKLGRATPSLLALEVRKRWAKPPPWRINEREARLRPASREKLN